MQGLDGDVCAFEVIVDLAPLDAFGELVARTAGLDTFDLRWSGGRYELAWRGAWEIESSPPGKTADRDVLNEHRCGVDIAHRGATTLSHLDRRRKDEFLGDPPY
jgi:hypothetical protein